MPRLSLLMVTYDIVIKCKFYYEMWVAIQDGHATTSPAKAVGFLFVPLLGYIWFVYTFVGFAEDYNELIKRHSIEHEKLPVWLFTIFSLWPFALIGISLLMPIFSRLSIGLTDQAELAVALAMLCGFIALFLSISISLVVKICDAVNALPDSFTTDYSETLASS